MDASKQIANIAAYMGDDSRAAILWSLVGGESRPASELAMVANISPQAASSHLKVLLEGGLLAVHQTGRNKFYRLKGPAVAAALESLLGLALQNGKVDGIAHRTRPELVFARTCYDHLAGELAVGILRRLLDREYLKESDLGFRLTGGGIAFFGGLGLDAATYAKQRRRFAYPCLDWSQRVPHLGGALGAGLLDYFFSSRILAASKIHRGVRVTAKGEEALARLLALRLTHDRCSLAGG